MLNLNNLINKDVRFFQLAIDEDGNGPQWHKGHHLRAGIAKWTKIFRSLDLKKENPTIGLLHGVNFEYVCMLYAAVGIGANFVVLDARFDNNSTHKVFLPLDILVYDDCMYTMVDDISYWEENAHHLIDAGQVPKTKVSDPADENIDWITLDFDLIKAQMLSSTTSGSTDAHKTVTHSYQYMLDIALRNASVMDFSGRAAHIKNLYHGSSMPVFYLPTLIKSNFHYCVPWTGSTSLEEIKKYVRNELSWAEHLDINHILFPYSHMIDKFLDAVVECDMFFSDLTIYTLSYIKPEYKNLIKGRNIKIVSIFGCTETSGPVMINTLCNDNIDSFDPMVFYTLDDFFELTLLSDGTRVRSKNGLVDHIMSDRFEQISDMCYRHLGRSDLYRINDIVIDLTKLSEIRVRLGIDGDIIVDPQEQALYLVIWNNDDAQTIRTNVDRELTSTFNNKLIYVSKATNLNKLEFISGIKLNQEMVREHFRNIEG